MIVTPAQAGVQFKPAWIPACAGMTNRYAAKLRRKILYNISGTVRQPAATTGIPIRIFIIAYRGGELNLNPTAIGG
jgi:hypothetical protein